MGYSAFFNRDCRLTSLQLIEFVVVIKSNLWVLVCGQLGDARHPDEERQDVRVAVPALVTLVIAYLPLAGHRHQFFEAEVSLNDEALAFSGVINFIRLVDAFRLNDLAQLEPLTDVFPHHPARLRRMK